MRIKIANLTEKEKNHIRYVVLMCVKYWPNSHLGAQTPREDIRSAFRLFRNMIIKRNMSLEAALGCLESDAYRHMDM